MRLGGGSIRDGGLIGPGGNGAAGLGAGVKMDGGGSHEAHGGRLAMTDPGGTDPGVVGCAVLQPERASSETTSISFTSWRMIVSSALATAPF
jgi:hypothetical protein